MRTFKTLKLHASRKLLSALLAVLLAAGSAVPVFAITPEEALEATFAHIAGRPDLPAYVPPEAVPGYTDETVIQYFVEVAMYAEYEGYRGYLMRYESPIQYCFLGHPDEDDKAQVRALAAALNEVPGFPGISEAENDWDANVKIMFSSQADYEAQFNLHVPGYSWGYSSVWFYTTGAEKGQMSATYVWISDDAWPRLDRNSIICEELVQGLGLLNDPEYGYYSIFDQNRNDCDWPSDLDWAVVYLLYDPRMDRFATEAEAREIAQGILDSWK